jgi:Carboxypeptidase regulatory-like domain
MTLSIKSQYDAKMLVEKEPRRRHDLNTHAAMLTILFGCLGVIIAIVIFGSMLFPSSVPIPTIDPGFTGPNRGPLSLSSGETLSRIPAQYLPYIDLGIVKGFVMSSDGLPVDGALVAIYKHMGLANSADKTVGYSTSVRTESDGSYSFNSLPSGVYTFTVTYPDGVIKTIENYAVSPSSSSSYIFRE